MVDKTPSEITVGTPSDTSVVHSSQNNISTQSRSHNERDISRLQGTAPPYSDSKTYNLNDLVTQDDIIYRNITAILVGETFDPTKWSVSSFLETPINPTIVGSITSASQLDDSIDVYVVGEYAYVPSSSSNSLTIIDISDPTAPSIVGFLSNANMTSASGVFVAGNFAYVTANTSNSLTIVDISEPATPTFVGTISDGTLLNSATDVYVSGKYAYVASFDSNSLTIIDISDPTAPSIVGSLVDGTNLNGANSVHVVGNFAYVPSLDNNSISAIDISDPTAPSFADTLVDATNLDGAFGIYVQGNYAYVSAFRGNRLSIIDISDPTSLSLTGTIMDDTNLDGASGVFVAGNYAYVPAQAASALTIIDVSDPTAPTFVSTISSTGLNEIINVFVSGKYAYVVNFPGDTLTVIDINGIDSSSASIGNVEAGYLSVTSNAVIRNDLYSGGLNVGNNALVGGALNVGGRFQGAQGADVASASGITLGNGNYFDITGTTTINTMTDTDWQTGSVVILQFDGALTVTHNSGGTSPDADFELEGSVNFSTSAGDTLTVVFDGINWRETSRSVI